MSRLIVPAPVGANTRIVQVVEPGQGLVFPFPLDGVSFAREGSSLSVSMNGEGELVLENFFATGEDGLLADFELSDGTIVDGAAFLLHMDPDFDVSVAAGSGTVTGSGVGEYADDAASLVGGVGRLGSLAAEQMETAAKAAAITDFYAQKGGAAYAGGASGDNPTGGTDDRLTGGTDDKPTGGTEVKDIWLPHMIAIPADSGSFSSADSAEQNSVEASGGTIRLGFGTVVNKYWNIPYDYSIYAGDKGAQNIIEGPGSTVLIETEATSRSLSGISAEDGGSNAIDAKEIRIDVRNTHPDSPCSTGVSSSDGANRIGSGTTGLVDIKTTTGFYAGGVDSAHKGTAEVLAETIRVHSTVTASGPGAGGAWGVRADTGGITTLAARNALSVTAEGNGSSATAVFADEGLYLSDSSQRLSGTNNISAGGDITLNALATSAERGGATGVAAESATNNISAGGSITLTAAAVSGSATGISTYFEINGSGQRGGMTTLSAGGNINLKATTVDGTATGIFARSDARGQNSGMESKNDIHADGKLTLTVESDAGNAYGMYAYISGKNHIHDTDSVEISALSGSGAVYGMLGWGGSNEITGATTVLIDATASGGGGAYAMWTAAAGGVNGNNSIQTSDGSGSVTIIGDIKASTGGTNSIDMGDGNDILTISGNISAAGSGTNSINMGAGDDIVTISGNISGLILDGGDGADILQLNTEAAKLADIFDNAQNTFTNFETLVLNLSNGSDESVSLGDLVTSLGASFGTLCVQLDANDTVTLDAGWAKVEDGSRDIGGVTYELYRHDDDMLYVHQVEALL